MGSIPMRYRHHVADLPLGAVAAALGRFLLPRDPQLITRALDIPLRAILDGSCGARCATDPPRAVGMKAQPEPGAKISAVAVNVGSKQLSAVQRTVSMPPAIRTRPSFRSMAV